MSDITTLQTLDIVSHISFKAAELIWDRAKIQQVINDEVIKYSSVVPKDEKQLKEIKADINNKLKLAIGFAVEVERTSKEQITVFRQELKEDLQPLEQLSEQLTAQWQQIEQERINNRKIELADMKAEVIKEINLNENVDLSRFQYVTTWFTRGAKLDKVRDEMKSSLQQLQLEYDNVVLKNKARSELINKFNIKYGIEFIADTFSCDRYNDDQVEQYYLQSIAKQKQARIDAERIAEMKKIQRPQEPVVEKAKAVAEPEPYKAPEAITKNQCLIKIDENDYVVIAKFNKQSATFANDLKMLIGFLKNKNIDFSTEER